MWLCTWAEKIHCMPQADAMAFETCWPAIQQELPMRPDLIVRVRRLTSALPMPHVCAGDPEKLRDWK